MHKTVTLYNVIFPVWFLLLFPAAWIVVLPANFVIDSLVLLLAFAVCKLGSRKLLYKQSILKVWGFGFLADIIGTVLLLFTQFAHHVIDESSALGRWFYENIASAVAYNPFKNIYAFLFVLLAVALSGFLIYIFNYKIALKKWPTEDVQRKKAALLLALLTAPYIFFVPTSWLY